MSSSPSSAAAASSSESGPSSRFFKDGSTIRQELLGMEAVEKKEEHFLNIPVFKRNLAGRYQSRILHFDFRHQIMLNIKGEKEEEQRRFRFSDIAHLEADDAQKTNPLAFSVFFKTNTPYFLYAQSRKDSDILKALFEEIIKNCKLSLNTTCIIAVRLIKEGGCNIKTTFAQERRWLSLHKWHLTIYKDDQRERPLSVYSLYNTPIAKTILEDKKGRIFLVEVLLDHLQLSFRFDTSTEQEEWFHALLEGSQEDRQLLSVEKDQGAQTQVSKDYLKTQEEALESAKKQVDELRSELDMSSKMMDENMDRKRTAEKEFLDAQSQRINAESDLRKLENEIRDLEERVRKVEAQASKSIVEAKEEETKKSQYETDVDIANRRVEFSKRRLEELEASMALRKGDMNDVEKQLQEARREREEKELELLTLQHTKSAATQDVKGLADRKESLQKLLMEILTQESEVTRSSRNMIETAEASLVQSAEKKDNLAHKVADLAARVESARAELTNNKTAEARILAEISELENQLSNLGHDMRANSVLDDLDNHN